MSPPPIASNDDLDFASTDLGATESFLVGAYAKMAIDAGNEQPTTRITRRCSDPSASMNSNSVSRCRIEPTRWAGSVCAEFIPAASRDFIGQLQDVFAPGDVTLYSPPEDRSAARPALLRRAVAFIEGSAERDIALNDVADNIHVTPRALQYMFCKHLDMTPMEYLRRVRLHHAHPAAPRRRSDDHHVVHRGHAVGLPARRAPPSEADGHTAHLSPAFQMNG